ncbi:NarK family nitrate/nitrite MFS transporter [Bermanella marisrubri]|uniref:Nitrate/nitrite transporter n=1 Tax=Bermanella marisrubri TaxID=207949 RepID=Q1N0F4_9GAMM|nr:NarK family nitrate/nitrite MFS transporter [Bermanella marisrubri]EAT11710.1 Nitrate/nitrite transporter [Oceanobacter sp. RED65] [Bermanella marisrubri]QIZ83255.1 NarK family nitrate/nitrite MFS transporter [Bermanella marisrubri]
MSDTGINPLKLSQPKIRMLHISWFAFFLTFMVWFNHAPLMGFIKEAFDLTSQEVKALLILNVALTIPARIIIGMLVDRFGPRYVYSGLLFVSSLLCTAFALSQTYEQLALFRFLMGFVGAGFVIGIRLVGEWFPAKEVGIAEGIYGGWGNFGSAASAMLLPTVALIFGGDDGWRYALLSTACLAFVYSFIFFKVARNTPKGSTYFKPKKSGGLQVSNKRDLYFYLAMNVPMYLALAVLTWKLSPANLGLLSEIASWALYIGLALLFVVQTWQILKVNKEHLSQPVPKMQRYKYKQVAVLQWAYFVTFGSELAVVSMLPLFFMETFEGLTAVTAGLLASGFAFMNLVARPGGGWLSDKFGRRKTLSILICGLAVGYLTLSQIDSTWWIPVAVIATMMCSFFVQAGEGAVFAMVPLVKRSLTGQIAGMTGAYGNVGAVIYLTILSFVDYSTFFMVIAASAAFIFIAVQFLEEPEGHVAEINDAGEVELVQIGK